MSDFNPKLRVIWAVDPFARDLAIQRAGLRALRSLAARQTLEVEPVFIQGPVAFDIPADKLAAGREAVRAEGRARVAKLVGNHGKASFLPLRIIENPGATIRNWVASLLSHAHDSGAELIVASTHARKGLSRLALGSFAETLSLHSDLPLLVVNSKWKGQAPFREMVFATDLSRQSRDAFEEAMQLAYRLGCRVTIYHKLLTDWSPRMELVARVFPELHEAYANDKEAKERDIRDWVSFAATVGVRADGIVDVKPTESIAESVLKHVRRPNSLIALAGEHGPVSAVLLGSTGRKLMRASPHPVWVFRPRPQAASASTGSERENRERALAESLLI